MSQVDDNLQPEASSQIEQPAAARCRIADLEEKLQVLELGHAFTILIIVRETNYFMSQGRAIRRMVTLYDSLEDLINENDKRCNREDNNDDFDTSQNRLQTGYVVLNNVLPWFHRKASNMEYYKDYTHMLKKLRQGVGGARGNDTSKLKPLVPDWVNHEWKPDPPVDPEDKHCHRFANDACGRLLCPTELDWNNPMIYTDLNNLEEGLFKSKLLVQAFKAIFTSSSSAKDVAGDGDGANIIENNRCTKKDVLGKKVKTHVAQIIKMHKVSPRLIAYVLCQFWCNIVDFFECPPGRAAQRNMDRLLTWWMRKVFGTSRRMELSDAAKAHMSVNALAMQRARLDDALFDSE
ncbi:uncharacterized protein EDB93DRAFT_1253488 [Suillus bovinus]|uniref:uncharacterized protein n=1 Tax=Suillus bovinus TaxID=48563 RepID=UPI001B8812B8|nr:uncharacterized protein EDB93DRAFT_1253488 [Suillus bovinus]KAG2138107.1 hypothetical protein EDB93DRAFT_1253488 [Suillus bovinus]